MQESAQSITVVIPTYNRKASLKVTLDGLARQKYSLQDVEVIVVSDGSTDGTDAFLEEYAGGAPYTLRVITQANQGPAQARNAGVWAAKGEIIVFIDDDVEPVDDFLASHMAHHKSDDKIVVIGPMSPDPARRGVEPAWIAWEHAMLQKQYFNLTTGVWKQAWANHFYTGNASLRREHIVAVGGFDVEFKRQEDVELAHRMRRTQGVNFVFDPKADVIHRPHRSFASWLNVATSYGQCDVIRAREGRVSWIVVKNSYTNRNRTTRMMARLMMNAPFLAAPIRALLVAVAVGLYRAGVTKVAMAMLSMVYNVRYLESARTEMGAEQMSRLLFGPGDLPVAPVVKG
ncbi:exopolysaccharide biosynthesis glycosyltransferase EpsD [Capsulimonas corticalis]|nr:exopolysaccharide biosynthesis glycosyltransferase EpsD [Capsulimonas corticalis]